jgi:hypothetical protein
MLIKFDRYRNIGWIFHELRAPVIITAAMIHGHGKEYADAGHGIRLGCQPVRDPPYPSIYTVLRQVLSSEWCFGACMVNPARHVLGGALPRGWPTASELEEGMNQNYSLRVLIVEDSDKADGSGRRVQ